VEAVSASDWLLLVQTLVLAATIIPAALALKATAATSHREAQASRIRADEARLDQVADQIARVSVAAEDLQQGREHNKGRMQAEQLRLQALIAPFWVFRMGALRSYADDDPTHASADNIREALAEVTRLSQSLREQLAEVLEPPPRRWWQVWRW